jgi:LemA protein
MFSIGISIVPFVLIALLVLLIIWVIASYNRFVTLRNRVGNAWAQIEVQLKRRWDLIPNLVETVKGYAKHESATFEAVITARNTAANASAASAGSDVERRAGAENALTGALRQLFAVAEAYPELKANQNFLQLQTELRDTEDKLSFARQFYNDIVMTFNTALEVFPGLIIARLFNFQAAKLFETDPGEAATPQVQF